MRSITTFAVNRHTAKLEATTRKYNSILKRKIRKIIVPAAHVTIIIELNMPLIDAVKARRFLH